MSNRTNTPDAIETISAAAVGVGTAGVEQTRTKVMDGIEKTMKAGEKMVRFGQGNIEALTKANQIWAAGMQDLSKQVAASFQASVQETLGALKTLGTAKSLSEAIALQSELTRTAMEKAISEPTRLTGVLLKLSEQAIAPLATRVNAAVETFGKTA
jgi:phasin family protein